MTMPIALSTRKPPRRARLLAALILPLLALAPILVGGGSASAATVSAASGYCTDPHGWGGTFFCGSESWYTMPNGYQEAFVIGTDRAVWTRWNTSNGLNGGWVSLHGTCTNTGSPVGLGNLMGYTRWTWYISCVGTDGNRWYNVRWGSSDGSATWDGWKNYLK